MSKAIEDVLAERRRQIEVEGWTAHHDDSEHEDGDLALAGACYAAFTSCHDQRRGAHIILDFVRDMWPWGPEWWKPKGDRRNLVRAAALIIAEIEKLDRTEPAPQVPLADAGGESTPESPAVACPECAQWRLKHDVACDTITRLRQERSQYIALLHKIGSEVKKREADYLALSVESADEFNQHHEEMLNSIAELESQLAAANASVTGTKRLCDIFEQQRDDMREELAAVNEARQKAEKDAERYRWLRTSKCLSYVADTGPRPSTPSQRIAYAMDNYGKKTSDMIEIRLLCYHLGPHDEPIWVDGKHFDYGLNMDAAIDAAIAQGKEST